MPAKKRSKFTDKQRLDFLEAQANGINIVHDDNQHWAVTDSGMGPVITGSTPKSFMSTAFVEANQCRKTLRAAIDAAIEREDED